MELHTQYSENPMIQNDMYLSFDGKHYIGHWHQVVTCKCIKIKISICCLLDCDSRIIMSMTHSCPFSSAFVPPLSASYTRSTIGAFTIVACFLEGKQCPGPCLTTSTWRCHKNFSYILYTPHQPMTAFWLVFSTYFYKKKLPRHQPLSNWRRQKLMCRCSFANTGILANGSAAFIESCAAIGWNSCDSVRSL